MWSGGRDAACRQRSAARPAAAFALTRSGAEEAGHYVCWSGCRLRAVRYGAREAGRYVSE
jgi:hypothetical protein